MKKFKLGFTLAEVLITLAIIGVVAAIVMPSVVSSYQYKAVGTKIAKFVATTENASRAYVASNDSFAAPATTEQIDRFMNDTYIFRQVGRNQEVIQAEVTGYTAQNAVRPLVGTSSTFVADDIAAGQAITFHSTGKLLNDNGEEQATSDTDPTPLTGAVGVGRLKDNTAIGVVASNNTVNQAMRDAGLIDPAKTGDGSFVLVFDPQVAGIPAAVQHTYRFVVTELGYVYPDSQDPCTLNIFNNDWATRGDMYTNTNAVCSGNPTP